MEDQENYLVDLLRERGSMTTAEIEKEVSKAKSDCPDGAVKTLMRLKTRGVLEGKMVPSKRGWVWSLKEQNKESPP